MKQKISFPLHAVPCFSEHQNFSEDFLMRRYISISPSSIELYRKNTLLDKRLKRWIFLLLCRISSGIRKMAKKIFFNFFPISREFGKWKLKKTKKIFQNLEKMIYEILFPNFSFFLFFNASSLLECKDILNWNKIKVL